MKRIHSIVGAIALLGWLACSDGATDPTTAPTDLIVPDLIVSDELAIAPAAPGRDPVGLEPEAPTLAYVSLPPGTLPNMVSVQIRNVTSGWSASPIPMIDGGFDPVPVAGVAGDELEVAFTDARGSISVAHATIRKRRPPRVVRTSPPGGRTDVALSIRPVVVFSEPIDPTTLPTGMRLLSDGVEVEANVDLPLDTPWIAELTPAVALESETAYELQITAAIRDLDGDALEEPITATFSTAPPPFLAAIAFVSSRNGTGLTGIYVSDPGGSEVRRIAAGQRPALSWDGSRIAFSRPSSSVGPAGIYVMNTNGSDLRYLGPGVSPAWSPDGRIAFVRGQSDPPSFGLYIMNADGSVVTELLSPSWLCGSSGDCVGSLYPTWSPDGQTIAFHAWDSPWRGIGIVRADGSDPRLLPELSNLGQGVNTRAAWSPDGSRLAVITGNPWLLTTSDYEIYSYDMASAALALVHRAPGIGVGGAPDQPDWTPDGTGIVFDASVRDGDPRLERRIFTVSLETGEVRQLIPDATDPVHASYRDYGAVWARGVRR